MCGRFTLRTPAVDIAKYFNLSAQAEWQTALRYNISPSQDVPVIRSTDGHRDLTMMRWGLIPSWAKDPKIGYSMINARSETAAEKPSFRAAMKKRRCLIPADGFYEWQKQGKTKQPFYIRLREQELFAFAGLWERWQDVESCTILTTSANELLAPLHDRMPVILSPNDYDTWLDPATSDVSYLLDQYPAEEMIRYPVNPVVNNARHEGADCVEAN
jgi:putative SOS response-associated peptidase YedK